MWLILPIHVVTYGQLRRQAGQEPRQKLPGVCRIGIKYGCLVFALLKILCVDAFE
jgi:hypothetical protein